MKFHIKEWSIIKPAFLHHFSLTGSSPLDDKEVHWGFKDILKLFGLYVFILLLLPVPNKLHSPISMRIADWGAMLILAVLYRHFGFWPSLEYFELRWSDFKKHFKTGVVWGVVIKAVPTLLAMVVLLIVALFIPLTEFTGNNPLPSMGQINLDWMITALHIGIVVPIFEEIIFRGLIHSLLRKRYGFKKALVISSIFFGLMHGIGAVTIFAIVAGLGLALLYEKTGSLAPGMVAHSVGNLISVVFSALQFI